MDKTRVVCVEKALFTPKSNVKVVNSIKNGGQYDIDRRYFLLLQSQLCHSLELQNEIMS